MKKFLFLSLGAALFLSACGDERATSSFAGAILPVVDAATPAGLAAAKMSYVNRKFSNKVNLFSKFGKFAAGDDATVKAGIDYLFQSTYMNMNGDTETGFFRSAINTIDSRASLEGPGMIANFSTECTADVSYTPAITGLASANNITIYPSCYQLFGSDGQSGAGSGYAYGERTEEDGTLTVTSWITLVQSNDLDKFAMLGKIGNAGAATDADKTAEVVFMEYGDAGGSWGGRKTFYHIKANPGSNAFEITYASTQDSAMDSPAEAGGTDPQFGCGVQIVSDGTHIRAAGGQGAPCGSTTAFDTCFDAVTGDVTADGDCSSLSFTMSAITHTDASSYGSDMATAMLINNGGGNAVSQ